MTSLAPLSRIARVPRARRRALVLVAALAAAGTLQVLGANPAVPQTTALTALRTDEADVLDPQDRAWKRAPKIEVPLTAQNVTYPFGGGSVPAVRAQAMHDGEDLLLRVSWDDSTEDGRAVAPEEFADAVAVQFPATAGATAPAICMGQADGGVNIWQWRADSERELPDRASELHADGYADLYPATDDLHFPAREVGNPYAQPDAGPVQDLVAAGFGSLGPAADQSIEGQGARDGDGWAVVFKRPFSVNDDARPEFKSGATTDVALAAWNGSEGDRTGQKSVSAFLRLTISDELLPSQPRTAANLVLASGGVIGGLFVLVLGFTHVVDAGRRRQA